MGFVCFGEVNTPIERPQVFPDSCAVEDFARRVSGQHVIVAHGDYTEAIRDFCALMDIDLVM